MLLDSLVHSVQRIISLLGIRICIHRDRRVYVLIATRLFLAIKGLMAQAASPFLWSAARSQLDGKKIKHIVHEDLVL
jgi:hypothetical protein